MPTSDSAADMASLSLEATPAPSSAVIEPSLKPLEISLRLSHTAHTVLHLHLTFFATSTLLFLTTTTTGEPVGPGGASKPLGSFVYALPDRLHPPNVLSTPIYSHPSSLDYATRTAKILARRTDLPVYVGCSGGVGFGGDSLSGATAEEEMEGLKLVVQTVMDRFAETRGGKRHEL